MASIKDVAKLAGVSIATVSRFMADPNSVHTNNRERVRQAIADTGYAPNALARNFRRGRTGQVMVVLPDVGDPFLSGIMKGISQAAGQEGFSLLILEVALNTRSWEDYRSMVLSKQADGIILMAGMRSTEPAPNPRPVDQHAPIVLVCENVPPQLGHFPNVRIDNVAAARDATRHLVHQGHRKIAFIAGPDASTVATDRKQGYRQAMDGAGLKPPKYRVIPGAPGLAKARAATRKLIEHKSPPTAILCCDDEMAIGAMHEIKGAGLRIPEDVSVLGFNDIRYAEVLDPPLTTIAQPAQSIGERAMLRLSRVIAGIDTDPEADIVPHKLIVRGSTGAPDESRFS
jgi:LacI family repressor for deo operon, udp, cdd, tsx, nupC, and nupG